MVYCDEPIHPTFKCPSSYHFIFPFNANLCFMQIYDCSLEPKPIAKSMLILDVKPWDDETSEFE